MIMKKLIIMSLAFFALAIVGCKRETPEEKCKKQEGKVWNASEEECENAKEEVADTKEKCEENGTMKWNEAGEEGKKCVAKTEAECNATTPAGKVEWKDGKCAVKEKAAAVATHNSIRNGIGVGVAGDLSRTIKVTLGSASKDLAKSACVLVAKGAKVKIEVVATTDNPPLAGAVVCDSTDTATDNDCADSNTLVRDKRDAAGTTVTGDAGGFEALTANQVTPETCTEKLEASAAAAS